MAHSATWFVIINPTSGNGKCKRKWPDIEQLLVSKNFDFTYEFTTQHNHGKELTCTAIENGYRHLICVGGDGTIHNVINGIMSQTKCPSSDVHLGVIPIGTGNDWIKSYGISKDPSKAIQAISNGVLEQQDIGKIEFLNEEDNVLYFNNLAGVGFDGLVVSKVHKYKHLGSIAYIFGALFGLTRAKNFSCIVSTPLDVRPTKALMVLVGLCRYSGGGMQLTVSPDPKDGLFDVSIAENFTGFDVLKNLPKLFNGKISRATKISTYKTNEIIIEVNENSLPYIQADGELIGKGGMRISIISKALSFYRP